MNLDLESKALCHTMLIWIGVTHHLVQPVLIPVASGCINGDVAQDNVN
jgi:hypothetical protein